ncbi:MAG: hypothetical protein R3C97_11355 [Geminicoccaceae bacterium]
MTALADQGVNTNTISAITGIPYETVRRHLDRMVSRGMVSRDVDLNWQLTDRMASQINLVMDDIVRAYLFRVIGGMGLFSEQQLAVLRSSFNLRSAPDKPS